MSFRRTSFARICGCPASAVENVDTRLACFFSCMEVLLETRCCTASFASCTAYAEGQIAGLLTQDHMSACHQECQVTFDGRSAVFSFVCQLYAVDMSE